MSRRSSRGTKLASPLQLAGAQLAGAQLAGALLAGALLLAPVVTAQDFDVRLRNRVLSAEANDPGLIRALGSSSRPRTHVILRFQAPLTASVHATLRSEKVTLLEYLENNAYLASIPTSIDLSARVLPGLRGADMIQETDRLDTGFLRSPPPWTEAPPNGLRATIEFHEDVSPAEIAALPEFPDGRFADLGGNTWSAVLPVRAIRQLARRDEVKRIHPAPAPSLPLAQTQRVSIRTNQVQQMDLSQPAPAYALDGASVRIGICDSGAWSEHSDFQALDGEGQPSTSSSRISFRPTWSEHGTAVAAIAGGNGWLSVTDGLSPFEGRGHAPNVRIGDYPQLDANYAAYWDVLVHGAVSVTNHSYVQSWGDYDATARALDELIRGDATVDNRKIPARPQVWAAGNNGLDPEYAGSNESGYHSLFTTAKNSISVGSVNSPHHGLTPLTSLGPTFDGRIKPDVVAPGCRKPVGIKTAVPFFDGYKGFCGTSFSAPAATGVLALLMHKRRGEPELPPASYRAVLIHTARDLAEVEPSPNSIPFNNPDTGQPVKYHRGPDFATGWGLINAEGAARLIDDPSRWRHGTIPEQHAQDVWCVSVPGPFRRFFFFPFFTRPLKVTVAWDDLPASTSTSWIAKKLVNDLDLALVSPAGTIVRPWTLDPLPLKENGGDNPPTETFSAQDIKPAYRGVDHINNVEVASIRRPERGTWTIVVRGHRLPMGKGQSYSLVSSYPIGECE